MGYGADQAGTPPFFVVTHSPPTDVRLERDLGMRFSFAADLVTAIDRARSAAAHGSVVIMGAETSSARLLSRASSTNCACTSPRCCWAVARRCSGQGRARG